MKTDIYKDVVINAPTTDYLVAQMLQPIKQIQKQVQKCCFVMKLQSSEHKFGLNFNY